MLTVLYALPHARVLSIAMALTCVAAVASCASVGGSEPRRSDKLPPAGILVEPAGKTPRQAHSMNKAVNSQALEHATPTYKRSAETGLSDVSGLAATATGW
jgi:hypothetical protein